MVKSNSTRMNPRSSACDIQSLYLCNISHVLKKARDRDLFYGKFELCACLFLLLDVMSTCHSINI